MPNYVQQFDSITIPNLPGRFGTITPDPTAESLIANIADENGLPLVQYWLDPAPGFFATEAGFLTWRDRMSGEKFRVTAGSPTLGPGINSQPALILDGAGRLTNVSGNARFNANGFSTVAVCRTTLTTGIKMLVGRANTPTEPTPVCPMFMIQEVAGAGGRNMLVSRENGGGGAVRAAHNTAAVDYASTNLLVVNTYSPQTGVSLRRNGVEVARNTAAVAPLTTTAFALAGDLGANFFNGQLHHIFICRADISLPQWKFALDRIESFLLSKYAITQGA